MQAQRSAPPRSGTLRVAVMAITRNRPRMLGELLASLARLDPVPDVEVAFVVVENSDAATVEAIVDGFRRAVAPCPVTFALETELGIPFARNRACEVALAQGADALVFIDDDETAPPEWLGRLVARYRSGGLALIGGPVRAGFGARGDTLWRRLMQAGIAQRYATKARRAEAAVRAGREDRVTVVTSNWLADASLMRDHGLRFDPRLRFTGGSDTAFWRAARAAGHPTGWAPGAEVIESIPDDRVSWRYQFRRAMEQSRASLDQKVRRVGYGRALAAALPAVALRLLAVAGLAVLAPLGGGRALMALARSAGWVAGRMSGLLGAQSSLYRQTTGS